MTASTTHHPEPKPDSLSDLSGSDFGEGEGPAPLLLAGAYDGL